MPEKIEYDDEELYNSLLVPGQCHDYSADVGLTDVPAWTFCQPCARTGGDLSALAAPPPPDIPGRLPSARVIHPDRHLELCSARRRRILCGWRMARPPLLCSELCRPGSSRGRRAARSPRPAFASFRRTRPGPNWSRSPSAPARVHIGQPHSTCERLPDSAAASDSREISAVRYARSLAAPAAGATHTGSFCMVRRNGEGWRTGRGQLGGLHAGRSASSSRRPGRRHEPWPVWNRVGPPASFPPCAALARGAAAQPGPPANRCRRGRIGPRCRVLRLRGCSIARCRPQGSRDRCLPRGPIPAWTAPSDPTLRGVLGELSVAGDGPGLPARPA